MLKQALRIASTSTCRQKHGAVITRGGSVIAVGINTQRNHPSIPTDRPRNETPYSYHAEANAIRGARKSDIDGATLWVARINNQGAARLSLPCESCMNLIIKSGIKRVVFTTNDHKIGEIRL